MAGWSEVDVDEHTGATGVTFRWNEFLVNLKSGSPISSSFDNFLKEFLKESGSVDCAKFFPPILVDGQPLDLLKLFLVVREKGGCAVLSKNGLWDSVAEEFELDLSFGPYLKLVHVKYLLELEKQLESLVSSEDILKGILSEMKKSKYSELESESSPVKKADSFSGEQHSSRMDYAKSAVDTVETWRSRTGLTKIIGADSSLCGDNNCIVMDETMASGLTGSMKVADVEDSKSVVVGIDRLGKGGNEDTDDMLDRNVVEESVSSRKRKQESACQMLNWIRRVSQNPCDPTVEKLPEKSKWKSYGSDKLWRQVLLARDALLIKRDVVSSSSPGQENRMMHPCMYEDQSGSGYNFRDRSKSRRNLVFGGRSASRKISSGTQPKPDSYTPGTCSGDSSSSEYSIVDRRTKKAVPVGPAFQADLPKWVGKTSESEQRWLGTRIWPLINMSAKDIIEREPIGKGRQDSCGCKVPSSEECVRFHIKERKLRMKRELGTAFYIWGFNKMGEDVKLCWTEEEQKRFMTLATDITPASGRNLFDEITKKFPRKRREDLVRYYFNVFLLWRRANQNRFTPNAIFTDAEDSDEDDDESGVTVNGSGSILGSTKKSRKKV
ncbi:AT-rich interactive domain-containing protein 2 [Linum perenne]